MFCTTRWKYKFSQGSFSAFHGLISLASAKVRKLEATEKLAFDTETRANFIRNGLLIKRVVVPWNNDPKSESKNKYSYENVKIKLKQIFSTPQIEWEVKRPELGMKCWRDYCLNKVLLLRICFSLFVVFSRRILSK